MKKRHMAGKGYGGEYGAAGQAVGAQLHHFFDEGVSALEKSVGAHSVDAHQNYFFFEFKGHGSFLSSGGYFYCNTILPFFEKEKIF